MMDKLLAVTNQLLDLGKRNRLLNYRDTGLKTLALLNRNLDEIFRNIKGYKDVTILDSDSLLNQYHNENFPNDNNDNPLKYDAETVYGICRKFLQPKQILCYKSGYGVIKAVKSLSKDFRTSIVEKGMNCLYISFGFIHYKEEGEEFIAPLLLIPIEIANEGGWVIRQYEDDVILNPTFKYYMQTMMDRELIDYKDEALGTYFDKVKESLPEGLVLEESMSIGVYSFYKMSMYQDIMNNKDKVLSNNNIKILLGDEFATSKETKENQPIYPVVECDSSQLGAIQLAANGKSFCLQGPPGSGKSQTITNIIATLLGQGKKILFVSEKIAALNVVFENLRRVHLAEFGIELHSNKANKKEFIENLYNTATLPKYDIDLKTTFLSAKYDLLTGNLSSYEKELHSPIPDLGISLLDLYSLYMESNLVPMDEIDLSVQNYNLYDMEQILDYVKTYVRLSHHIGYDYRKSSLNGLNQLNENYILYDLNSDLDIGLDCLDKMYKLATILAKYEGFYVESINDGLKKALVIDKLSKLSLYSPFFVIKKSRTRIIDLIKKYLNFQKILGINLFDIYDKQILNENLDLLREKYVKANEKGKFFNKELKECNEVIYKYRKVKSTADVIIKELQELIAFKRNLFLAKEVSNNLSKYIGELKGLNLKQIVQDLSAIDDLPDINLSAESFNYLKAEYVNSKITYQELKGAYKNLDRLSLMFDKRELNFMNAPLEDAYNKLIAVSEERENFTNFMQVNQCIKHLKFFSALDFLNAYLDNEYDIDSLPEMYRKTFLHEKILHIVSESNLLTNFRSDKENKVITDFRALDKSILSINRDFIISVLSQKRPNENVLEGSEFKILTKEYSKLRRQLPIRVLLEQIFNLVLDIKPVFLMSPLSVSTYLASELNIFDCVIFDEASQIFASDALGSIYRGKQCIVIGDTKQMPPTNFFHATLDGQQEQEVEYDLESILDKASQTFETTSLKWHYRSRSEELITFSNGAFYDWNLITIPQAKQHEKGFGVDFYYVPEGRYDMSTRTNQIEAEKIVEMVFKHFDTSKESLGVVAFSNVQADLIQSLVDKYRRKHPEYDRFFDEGYDEPFFVKNLETVQGDERDRIIFSICYGYNEEGKFYQRFGPLNNLGGERRLNVAVTRAKYNVSIVSSVRYLDIKDKTDAKGVLLLRDYLKFAENVVTDKNYQEISDPLMLDIKEYIESLGYEVLTKYGSSSFKIDFAVKKNDEFVLAIMLDGSESYKANLRDKYRLERMLLKRLGWRYFKLFTTSWILHNEDEMERLRYALEHPDFDDDKEIEEDKSFLKEDKSIDSFDFNFEVYHELVPERAKKYLETFDLEYLVREIIRIEAPIHFDLLCQRVLSAMEKGRMNDQLKKEISDAIPSNCHKIGDFILGEKITGIKLRLNSNRKFDYIYFDELLDGLYCIIEKNSGIKADGLFKTLTNILSFDKVTPQIRTRLEDALDQLVHDFKVRKDGDSYKIA